VSALQTLVLAAQVAGVSPSALEAPAFESGIANSPQPILSLPLAEIRAAQNSSIIVREVDGVSLSFSAASGPEMLWLRVSGEDETHQWSWKTLSGGVSASFGGKIVKISADDRGLINVGSVSFNLLDEMWRLYGKAVHIRIDPVLYAVTYEDGSAGIPHSISLIRRDTQGMGWIAYRDSQRLATIHYFIAVNGVLYGMRLEGENLVFYAKPNTASAQRFEEHPAF